MNIKDRKPIIGVVVGPWQTIEGGKLMGMLDNMRIAIIQNGGIPIAIMPTKDMIYLNNREEELFEEDKEILDMQLSLCDGILLPGGDRIYNYNRYICKKANEKNMPLFGICMGMQTMCNYNNENKNNKVEGHCIIDDLKSRHNVEINKESKLYSIIQRESIAVNSYHNYAVPNSGEYTVVAKCR